MSDIMNMTQKDNQVKYCKECNRELEIGTNWTKARQKTSCYICKDCISIIERINYIQSHPNYKPRVINNPIKYCIDCGCELILDINWTESRKNNWQYLCKDCQDKRNRDKVQSGYFTKKNAKWRGENPEKFKVSSKKYRESIKGKVTKRKSQAKRRRDLGWIPMLENPFDVTEEVEWHHITDIYVVAIPRDLHKVYTGYSTERHRELVMNVAKQIYLDK